MKMKKNKNINQGQADEFLHQLSDASKSEQFLTYIFSTLNISEWLKGVS